MKRAAVLLTVLWSLAAAAMDVDVRGPFVFLTGHVDGTELRRLSDALDQHPGITTVILKDSSGGDSRSGYAVGEFIRAKGLDTGVSGRCMSSCSRMFLGGKRRFFTDDQPPERTVVGLHGNYKSSTWALDEARIGPLKAWIAKYTEGKARPELVDQWVRIANHKGFAYFYHPVAAPERYGADRVLLCQGNEQPSQRFRDCAKPGMGNALENGIVTTLEILKSASPAKD